jgi:hypothetical protein
MELRMINRLQYILHRTNLIFLTAKQDTLNFCINIYIWIFHTDLLSITILKNFISNIGLCIAVTTNTNILHMQFMVGFISSVFNCCKSESKWLQTGEVEQLSNKMLIWWNSFPSQHLCMSTLCPLSEQFIEKAH